jgi:hypothetical protein
VPSKFRFRIITSVSVFILSGGLAAGQTVAIDSAGAGRHAVSLEFHGASITARIDGSTLQTVSDSSYSQGMAGLGVVAYALAQFDNVKVDSAPTAR